MFYKSENRKERTLGKRMMTCTVQGILSIFAGGIFLKMRQWYFHQI